MFKRLAMIAALLAAVAACSPSGGSASLAPGATLTPVESVTPSMSPTMGLESVAPTQ
jgi:hypothetical protein